MWKMRHEGCTEQRVSTALHVLEVRNIWYGVRALMRRSELLVQNAQVVDELLFAVVE